MSEIYHSTSMDEYALRTIVVVAFAFLLISIVFRHWWGVPGYAAILIAGLTILKKLDDAEEEAAE